VIVMNLIAGILVVAALAPGSTPSPRLQEARLAALVGDVMAADYKGDRGALERLDAVLARLGDGPLSEYRDYWRGYARWRRAANGFSKTPLPADLADDLEKAVGDFRAALRRRPDWVEARLALVGCWASLAHIARDDAEKKKAILADFLPELRWLEANGRDNPRAMWILGGLQLAAPPPYGGDPVKAAATLRKGVELSWREAGARGSQPAWIPSWGGPENLMNLAYVYSHVGTLDRTAALAYAEGALTAVPQWHYVRDVLLPQIEALPAASANR
jgi:hypothetical protein